MSTVYFGEKWDAPATDNGIQVPTPVGELCFGCEGPIEDGDRGFVFPHLSSLIAEPTTSAIHLECQLRQTLGGSDHVLGRSPCRCAAANTPELRRADARRVAAWVAAKAHSNQN